MPEFEEAYLLAAAGIIVVILAAYVYTALSAPKGLFRRPVDHIEIKDFRRMKGK